MTAPPMPYFGAKGTIAGQIVALLPPHGHYVEPFCGSLAVLLAKPRSPMETVNDLDGQVMTFWRVLRDRPEELARACMLTPHSRAEHEAAYDLDGIDDLELARRVFVRLTQGRSSKLRRTGWRYFRDRAGSSLGMPGYLASYSQRIIDAAERIAGVSLECRTAVEVITAYGQHADTLIYADPPYLASTRGWGNNYRIEMRDEPSHRELSDALHGCVGPVVLSGYASELYDDELFADWHRVEIQTGTGNANVRARTEILWSNRPIGSEHLFSGGSS